MSHSRSMIGVFTLSVFGSVLFLAGCNPNGSGNSTKVSPLTTEQKSTLVRALKSGELTPEFVANGLRKADTPAGEKDACASFIATLPASTIRGSIVVPEDWQKPNGTTIKVFYYYKPVSPNTTPIVFFNGGPGGDSHSSNNALATSQMKDLPFVFVDQRGTGCSTPYPITEPSRLVLYGTRSIVKDAEAVRAKLFGSRKWKVFGQSYGGLIVHRYAEIAPEGVAGFFSHGFALMNDPVEWVVARNTAQVRIWDEYAAKFPGDDAIMRRARQQITQGTCFSDGTNKVCGPEMLDSFIGMLGFNSSWPSLHKWVTALVDANGNVSQPTLAQIAKYFVFGIFMHSSEAGDVITRLEITPGESDQSVCKKAVAVMNDRGIDVAGLTVNECRMLTKLAQLNPSPTGLLDSVVADPVSLPALKQNIDANPSAPFFLYSGGKDGFSPVEIFNEEPAYLMSSITYRNFPATGHEGFMTEPAVLSDILSVR